MPSTVPVVGNTELDKAHALNKFKETLSRIAIIHCDKSIINYELSPTGSRGRNIYLLAMSQLRYK